MRQISDPRQRRLRCRFKLNVLTFNFMLLKGLLKQYNSSHCMMKIRAKDTAFTRILLSLLIGKVAVQDKYVDPA